MSGTEWKEILNLSQKELVKTDKDKLCEILSWMDLDDIEISFTDLKTLFKLAQDILKYKTEQVSDLLSQSESKTKLSPKYRTRKSDKEVSLSSNDSSDATLKQIMKSDKDTVKRYQSDVTKLQDQKKKLQKDVVNNDRESDSSRNTLSEIDAVMHLENEITMKNNYIRKLLKDIKMLEHENTKFKEKVLLLKDKLTDSTSIINNFTEQTITINNEYTQLKEAFADSEEAKVQLSFTIETLKNELKRKETNSENTYEDIKNKLRHWKNIARSKKSEVDALCAENKKIKDLTKVTISSKSPNMGTENQIKIKELQEKLIEASKEIEQSANFIKILRSDNIRLRNIIKEMPDNSDDLKNESDDGKERTMINKLKRRLKSLTTSLQVANEMVTTREKELAEISTTLHLLNSKEGISPLLEGIRDKERQLKLKDNGIKSLVEELNGLREQLNDLEIENETLRQRFNVPVDEKIPTGRLLKYYRNLESCNKKMIEKIRSLENQLIFLEFDHRTMKTKVCKMTKEFKKKCPLNSNIGESFDNLKHSNIFLKSIYQDIQCDGAESIEKDKMDSEPYSIIQENEGLRKGLQEISEFLKDNSTTSSGILKLECPSLEAVLRCMEARHMAGWFAPHMAKEIELRTILGGKDALLTALHETRMETYDVLDQLSKESEKSFKLEQKLVELENMSKSTKNDELPLEIINLSDFGNWITDEDKNIDVYNNDEIESLVAKGDSLYEKRLLGSLQYFHIKLRALYDKMTKLAVEAVDNQNRWSIKEEQYNVKIEILKSQLEEKDDTSEVSPGIVVHSPKNTDLERKFLYIEEIYKQTKTLHENAKNENFELRKENMAITSQYEIQIQTLILSLVALTNRLRSSIDVDLFWKQNKTLGELNLKYRQTLENNIISRNNSFESHICNGTNKMDSMNNFLSETNVTDEQTNQDKNLLRNTFLQLDPKTRLEPAYSELFSNVFIKIDHLEKTNKELQAIQATIIDDSLATITKQDVGVMKDQLDSLFAENKILKEQYQRVRNELELNVLQVHNKQKQQMNIDLELNLLRHQIIDLQSSGDNKAVIARLSNEVLTTHIKASEYQNKLENVTLRMNREKELRIEAENLINVYQKNSDANLNRYQFQFKYMYKILQILRQQYHGSIPLLSVEDYLSKLEDLSRKEQALNDQLTGIEDLRSNLMIKHSVFEHILDISKSKCLINDENCPHKLQYVYMEKTHIREIEYLTKKIENADILRLELIKQNNNAYKHLILVNQAFEKNLSENSNETNKCNVTSLNLNQAEDPQSELNSRLSQTFTLSKAAVLKPEIKENKGKGYGYKNISKNDVKLSTIGTQCSDELSVVCVQTQTLPYKLLMLDKALQTDDDIVLNNLQLYIEDLKKDNEIKTKQLKDILYIDKKRSEEILVLNSNESVFESKIQNLHKNNTEKDNFIQRLRNLVDELKKQINDITTQQIKEQAQLKETLNVENKSLLQALKQLDCEKNNIVTEYNDILSNERNEFSKFIKELQLKIVDLETKLSRRGSDSNATNADTLKDVINKYTTRISPLEEKCFRLQSELDECKTELTTYHSEVDRWKDLANERLSKMEQLNSQLEERHCYEVDSYKAENQHWLSQMNETQKEHMELRTRLTEQKALYIKQLADKDVHIEQLRTVVHNLKTQVINMQTMLSVSDANFDMSAIVEVDESSDVLSQNGSDRLEIKYDSKIDLNDDDMLRIPGSSTTIWQETIIERLRREKQLAGKQNATLRRQIKALAARERRSRLDAQNLKNQVFRINTSGNKVATAESTALQNKIASLQAQLTSARRDTQSNVALWDKWKRAQQTAERWQSRYEDKCHEIKRLESSLSLAKSSVTRLEREKRVLLSRLSETKSEHRSTLEKQDAEASEKQHRSVTDKSITLEEERDNSLVPYISTHALLQRVEAQQHRIAALEIAEKGNEHLVSEYERCLAEITSLKGQVLKLESTLLESQIRIPIKKTDEPQPELEYWKSYCEMLKEENVQLTLKISSMELAPTTASQHRVNILEQTILTLRGLVSKLHADQKSSGATKKTDSKQHRPRSGGSCNEKTESQLEFYRVEIANLKRSILDKDLLLEKSKEMLKIAAEREDQLLRENEYLRRQMEELTKGESF